MKVRRLHFLWLLIFIVPALACSGSFDVRVDENYSYLTITMTEAQVQDALENALSSGVRPALLNPEVDLRNGSIYIEGDLPRQNGGDPVPGNLTVRVYASGGELAAEVTSLNFNGFDANDDALIRLNDRLEEALIRAATNREGNSEYDDITITNTELSVTFRTPRPTPQN